MRRGGTTGRGCVRERPWPVRELSDPSQENLNVDPFFAFRAKKAKPTATAMGEPGRVLLHGAGVPR